MPANLNPPRYQNLSSPGPSASSVPLWRIPGAKASRLAGTHQAKALGAVRVVAAAGSADKADFARQCGADEVVTYSQPSWGDPVDLVLDGVGGELSSAALTLWPRSAGWSPSAPAAAPSAPEACSAN